MGLENVRNKHIGMYMFDRLIALIIRLSILLTQANDDNDDVRFVHSRRSARLLFHVITRHTAENVTQENSSL